MAVSNLLLLNRRLCIRGGTKMGDISNPRQYQFFSVSTWQKRVLNRFQTKILKIRRSPQVLFTRVPLSPLYKLKKYYFSFQSKLQHIIHFLKALIEQNGGKFFFLKLANFLPSYYQKTFLGRGGDALKTFFDNNSAKSWSISKRKIFRHSTH